MNNFSEEEIQRQFLYAMEQAGVIPRSNMNFIMDGEIHRFRTEDDKSYQESGEYKIHTDKRPAGYFRDFRKDISGNWVYELNQTEKEEYYEQKKNEYYEQRNSTSYEKQKAEKRRQEAMKTQEQQRQNEEREQALNAAIREYSYPSSNTLFACRHTYFKAKKIERTMRPALIYRNSQNVIHHQVFSVKAKKEEEDICNVGELLIPLTNAETGEFQTLQRISNKPYNDGKFPRGFYKGLPVKGACAELVPFTTIYDDYIEKIFICEGIATGLSFLEITENKYPVFAAMSAGNIINVAQGLRKYYSGIRYKNLKFIIAADNDNAGIMAAQKTIEAGYADDFITPPINGMDYNDYINYKKENK